MLSSSDGWAVGNGGTILRWNGSNWANFSSPTAYDLFGTAFLSSSNGWAVCGGWSASIGWFEGAKLHWNGSSWSVDTTDHILDILYDVDFSSPTYGWAVGMNNAKSRWDGANWHQNYGLQAMNSSQAVEILSANDGWAVGWNGSNDNIRHWDGTTWNVETSPVSGELHGITMSSSTEGWAVGDNGNILRYGP